jgi:hypothetical protein
VVTKIHPVRRAPDSDEVILAAYFGGKVSARTLAAAIRRRNIQGEAFEGGSVTLLDAAVAAVLLKSIRDELPQWAMVGKDGVTLGRSKNRQSVRSAYTPKHLFTLNWADSGPGFSWPMAYHATAVPAFKAMVVTASADGTDTYGFTDFAVGHFSADVDLLVGAQRVITETWAEQAADGQSRWEYLFEEALVNADQANEWADKVWPDEDKGEEDED